MQKFSGFYLMLFPLLLLQKNSLPSSRLRLREIIVGLIISSHHKFKPIGYQISPFKDKGSLPNANTDNMKRRPGSYWNPYVNYETSPDRTGGILLISHQLNDLSPARDDDARFSPLIP